MQQCLISVRHLSVKKKKANVDRDMTIQLFVFSLREFLLKKIMYRRKRQDFRLISLLFGK
jgi:hypothetical protein